MKLPPRVKDITGERRGYLVAEQYAGCDGRRSLWIARCDCGAEVVVNTSRFLMGEKKACPACSPRLRSESLQGNGATHGMSNHPAYWVWRSMNDRCRLPSHQAWHNYGGRGITVCDQWQASFENFWEDMGPTYKHGLTLDRRDNNGPYSPENCRWTDRKTQSRNTRFNRVIDTPQGRMTVAEASERTGIGVTTLLYRVGSGWPPERLFDRPDFTNRLGTS